MQEIYYAKSMSGVTYRGKFKENDEYHMFYERSDDEKSDESLKTYAYEFAKQISNVHRVPIKQYGYEASWDAGGCGVMKSRNFIVAADDPIRIGG